MTRASSPGRHFDPGRVIRTAGRLLDALLPAGCAICSAAVPGDRPPICGLCSSRVPAVPLPLCPRCGTTRLLDIENADRCPDCAEWPAYLRAASACVHAGVPARLIHGLKYRGYTALAPYLAARMVEPARRLTRGEAPVLVPVPLAASRRRERGFNQAALLATALGSLTGWRTTNVLSRPTGGPSLTRRGRHDRETIASGAYELTGQIRKGYVDHGRPVLIVDDVITTGATIEACSTVLVDAGLRCLGAVSFTRTAARLEQA